jgi:hypothetical protein
VGLNYLHRDHFFNLDNAPPGRDLCPCPDALSGEELEAYERLVDALTDLSGP